MCAINILIVSFIRAVAAAVHRDPRDIYAYVCARKFFPFFQLYVVLFFSHVIVSCPEVPGEMPEVDESDVETMHFKKAKLVRGPWHLTHTVNRVVLLVTV